MISHDSTMWSRVKAIEDTNLMRDLATHHVFDPINRKLIGVYDPQTNKVVPIHHPHYSQYAANIAKALADERATLQKQLTTAQEQLTMATTDFQATSALTKAFDIQNSGLKQYAERVATENIHLKHLLTTTAYQISAIGDRLAFVSAIADQAAQIAQHHSDAAKQLRQENHLLRSKLFQAKRQNHPHKQKEAKTCSPHDTTPLESKATSPAIPILTTAILSGAITPPSIARFDISPAETTDHSISEATSVSMDSSSSNSENEEQPEDTNGISPKEFVMSLEDAIGKMSIKDVEASLKTSPDKIVQNQLNSVIAQLNIHQNTLERWQNFKPTHTPISITKIKTLIKETGNKEQQRKYNILKKITQPLQKTIRQAFIIHQNDIITKYQLIEALLRAHLGLPEIKATPVETPSTTETSAPTSTTSPTTIEISNNTLPGVTFVSKKKPSKVATPPKKERALSALKKALESKEQIYGPNISSNIDALRGSGVSQVEIESLIALLKKRMKHHKLNIAIYESEKECVRQIQNKISQYETPINPNIITYDKHICASRLIEFKKASPEARLEEYSNHLTKKLSEEKTSLGKCITAYNKISSLSQEKNPAVRHQEATENNGIPTLIDAIDTNNIPLIQKHISILTNIDFTQTIFIPFLETTIERNKPILQDLDTLKEDRLCIKEIIAEIKKIQNIGGKTEDQLYAYKLELWKTLINMKCAINFNPDYELTTYEMAFKKLLNNIKDIESIAKSSIYLNELIEQIKLSTKNLSGVPTLQLPSDDKENTMEQEEKVTLSMLKNKIIVGDIGDVEKHLASSPEDRNKLNLLIHQEQISAEYICETIIDSLQTLENLQDSIRTENLSSIKTLKTFQFKKILQDYHGLHHLPFPSEYPSTPEDLGNYANKIMKALEDQLYLTNQLIKNCQVIIDNFEDLSFSVTYSEFKQPEQKIENIDEITTNLEKAKNTNAFLKSIPENHIPLVKNGIQRRKYAHAAYLAAARHDLDLLNRESKSSNAKLERLKQQERTALTTGIKEMEQTVAQYDNILKVFLQFPRKPSSFLALRNAIYRGDVIAFQNNISALENTTTETLKSFMQLMLDNRDHFQLLASLQSSMINNLILELSPDESIPDKEQYIALLHELARYTSIGLKAINSTSNTELIRASNAIAKKLQQNIGIMKNNMGQCILISEQLNQELKRRHVIFEAKSSAVAFHAKGMREEKLTLLKNAIENHNILLIQANIEVLGDISTEKMHAFLAFLTTQKEKNTSSIDTLRKESSTIAAELEKFAQLSTTIMERNPTEEQVYQYKLKLQDTLKKHNINIYFDPEHDSVTIFKIACNKRLSEISEQIETISHSSKNITALEKILRTNATTNLSQVITPKPEQKDSDEVKITPDLLKNRVIIGDIEYVKKHLPSLSEKEKYEFTILIYKEKNKAKHTHKSIEDKLSDLEKTINSCGSTSQTTRLFSETKFPKALRDCYGICHLSIPYAPFDSNDNIKPDYLQKIIDDLKRQLNLAQTLEENCASLIPVDFQNKHVSTVDKSKQLSQEPTNFLRLRKAVYDIDYPTFTKNISSLKDISEAKIRELMQVVVDNLMYFAPLTTSFRTIIEELTKPTPNQALLKEYADILPPRSSSESNVAWRQTVITKLEEMKTKITQGKLINAALTQKLEPKLNAPSVRLVSIFPRDPEGRTKQEVSHARPTKK